MRGGADMNNWQNEETDEPLLADPRNYYIVEKWTKDGGRSRVCVCRRQS
jgi:hypothetical protein